MPPAAQGDVHWYDYGPVIGAELSGHRPALIISNDDVNRNLGVAITLPMSTATPAERFRRQHVFISAADSWASGRQVKTAAQNRLGAVIGRASPEELDAAVESLARRFTGSHFPGEIATAEGAFPIMPGTIWQLTLANRNLGEFQTKLLVLDYNAGNNMAITVQIEDREPRPQSPVAVPVTVLDTGRTASAMVHRVLSIDTGQRDLIPVGHAHQADTGAAIGRLISLIQRPLRR